MITCTAQKFTGHGVTLVGDRWDPPAGRTHKGIVLLLHGGGQTRHSWQNTGRRLAEQGWCGITVDARGHGESEWAPDGDYSNETLAADIRCIVDTLGERPILTGASMGGLASLFAQSHDASLGRALVLVDITPRLESEGIDEVLRFMRSGLDGFDSLDDVLAAVAAHTPNRSRPPRLDSLLKNVREVDGRWHWHWDPQFLSRAQGRDGEPGTDAFADHAHEVARRISVPTLLVRGAESRVVSPEGVQEFLQVIPDARYVDITGTGHMVAGDDNDVFSAALLAFIEQLPPA